MARIVEGKYYDGLGIGALREGRVLFRGSPNSLIADTKGKVWELSLPAKTILDPSWRVATRVFENSSLRLRIVGEKPHEDASPGIPSLEEAYLALMRK
jgi:hypothetical protein